MDRQFADQAAHRVGAEVDIGQRRVAANRQRRAVSWRQPEAGLG